MKTIVKSELKPSNVGRPRKRWNRTREARDRNTAKKLI